MSVDFDALDQLIEKYGGETVVVVVTDIWGEGDDELTLDTLRTDLADIGSDTACMDTRSGYWAGDALLVDHYGNSIIELKEEWSA